MIEESKQKKVTQLYKLSSVTRLESNLFAFIGMVLSFRRNPCEKKSGIHYLKSFAALGNGKEDGGGKGKSSYVTLRRVNK